MSAIRPWSIASNDNKILQICNWSCGMPPVATCSAGIRHAAKTRSPAAEWECRSTYQQA